MSPYRHTFFVMNMKILRPTRVGVGSQIVFQEPGQHTIPSSSSRHHTSRPSPVYQGLSDIVPIRHNLSHDTKVFPAFGIK